MRKSCAYRAGFIDLQFTKDPVHSPQWPKFSGLTLVIAYLVLRKCLFYFEENTITV